ncbi:MAG: MoaD/ThiS family protein [Nitrosopumilus sp.]
MISDISITVKYLARVKEMTRCNGEIIVIAEGSTVSRLIDNLAESYGDQMRSSILDDEPKRNSKFSLIINGELLDRSKFDTIILKDNDEVAIIPPIAGG